MDTARWQYIKALQPPAPRMVHQSCAAGMRPNPHGENFPWVPWVQKPGKTLNTGRNEAKRALRTGARKTWGVLARVG